MFRLVNPALPETPYSSEPVGLPIARLADPAYFVSPGAPLAVVDYQAALNQPGIAQSEALSIQVVTIPTPAGGTVTLTGIMANTVTVIRARDRIYAPAANPSNPQPGEFLYDPYRGEAVLTLGGEYQATEGEGAEVLGTESLAIGGEEITNRLYVPPPYPDWFARVPLESEISIDLSAEQHPSGSMKLVANNYNIAAIRSAFRCDTKLSMFGVGFKINNYSDDQALLQVEPDGDYQISISLSGWNETECEQDTYLFGDAAIPSGVSQVANDPDCQIPGSALGTTTSIPTKTTVQTLATQVGIQVEAPAMEVPIPSDSPRSATTQVSEELEARLRHYGCFADYFAPGIVVARNLESVGRWEINDSHILERPKLTYQGKQRPFQLFNPGNLNPLQPDPTLSLPSSPPVNQALTLSVEAPDLIGYTVEYPKVRLSGKFLEPATTSNAEDQAGRNASLTEPKWRRRSPQVITLTHGDINPQIPPAGTSVLKVLGLNYTQSGPTKIEETETTEDGVPVRSTTRLYGWVFRGIDIKVDNGGQITLFGSPNAWWKQVKEEVVEHVYDRKTGYKTGINVSGWEIQSFLSETDALETVQLQEDNSEDAAKRRILYEFEKVPARGATRYLMRLFESYYADARAVAPPTVQYKVCLPDGSSQIRTKEDPTYAKPRWVAIETTSYTSFASAPSPEEPTTATVDGVQKTVNPPPLTKGRESFLRREVQVIPAKRNKSSFSRFSTDPPAGGLSTYVAPSDDPNDLDRWIEYVSDSSAEGAGFDASAEKASFQEHTGKPPEAPRKPPNLEQVQPEAPTGDPEQKQSQTEYEYWLTTPGYSLESPEQGSESYDYATTEAEALLEAKTRWKVEDVRQASRTLSVVIPFNSKMRPLDIVRATVNGITYPSRINSVSHSLKIVGVVDGALYCEGTTTLNLSPDREAPVTLHKQPLKGSGDTAGAAFDVNVIDVTGLEMGAVLTNTNRRNF